MTTNVASSSSSSAEHSSNVLPLCPRPKGAALQALLAHIRQLKRVYLEPCEVDTALHALLTDALNAHPALGAQLSAFGVCPAPALFGESPPQLQFHQPVDLQGLASCIKKHKFQRLHPVGSGANGVVFQARDVESGELVAIKRLAKSPGEDNLPEAIVREVAVLRGLAPHPNVVG